MVIKGDFVIAKDDIYNIGKKIINKGDSCLVHKVEYFHGFTLLILDLTNSPYALIGKNYYSYKSDLFYKKIDDRKRKLNTILNNINGD